MIQVLSPYAVARGEDGKLRQVPSLQPVTRHRMWLAMSPEATPRGAFSETVRLLALAGFWP